MQLVRLPLLAAVVVANVAALVIEVLEPRLLVGYLGDPWVLAAMSITLVLLCMSAGAFYAGRTDQPEVLLTVALVVAASWIAFTPALSSALAPLIDGSFSRGGWVLLAMLAVPSAALGVTSTTATRLMIAEGAPIGPTIGLVSALSSIAGVAGALLALLAPLTLPLSMILRVSAVAVFATAVLLLLSRQPHWKLSWPIIVLAAVAQVVGFAVSQSEACTVPSRNHCINVVRSADGTTTLYMDGVMHSATGPGGLADPVFDYVRWIEELTDSAWPAGSSLTGVHVGGGAGSLAAYFATRHPSGSQTVLEIDPDVIGIATDVFALDTYPGVEIREVDGRIGVSELPDSSTDVVILDAFRGLQVATQLTTVEYAAEVARIARPGALIVFNIIETPEHRLSSAIARTWSAFFPQSQLWVPSGDGSTGLQNAVLILGTADAVMPDTDSMIEGAELVPSGEWSSWVSQSPILRDDFAPASALSGALRL